MGTGIVEDGSPMPVAIRSLTLRASFSISAILCNWSTVHVLGFEAATSWFNSLASLKRSCIRIGNQQLLAFRVQRADTPVRHHRVVVFVGGHRADAGTAPKTAGAFPADHRLNPFSFPTIAHDKSGRPVR